MDLYEAKRELGRLRYEKDGELARLLNERTTELQAAIEAVRAATVAELDAKYAQWEHELTVAIEAAQEREIARERMRDQERLAKNLDSPLLGRKVQRGEFISDLRYGRIEVYREGDTVQEKLRYGRPQVGDLIIRELKKDGSNSRVIHHIWNEMLPRPWSFTKMNFKPGVVTDDSGKLYTNALVFATREEAQASADELMSRWMLVRSTGVIETEDPVNYRFVDGRNERIAP